MTTVVEKIEFWYKRFLKYEPTWSMLDFRNNVYIPDDMDEWDCSLDEDLTSDCKMYQTRLDLDVKIEFWYKRFLIYNQTLTMPEFKKQLRKLEVFNFWINMLEPEKWFSRIDESLTCELETYR
tara:strand:- start:4141 stop:4509 length:369 start_codon:yes stop_codon:yes gene_type:complete